MADTYKVVKGDTLSEIAQKYNSKYKYGSTNKAATARLAAINDIDNPNLIYVGQTLSLKNPSGKIKKKKNNSLTPSIIHFGIQSNSENTVFATWRFNKSHVKEYRCIWYYTTGDGVKFIGSDSTEKFKQSTYSPPSNATKVIFKVKPIATTHKVTTTKKVKGKTKKTTKDVAYWTGKWSKEKTCNFSVSQEPDKPSAPSVEMDKYKLTAKLENLDNGVNKPTKIEFYVVKNNSGKAFKQNKANVVQRAASYSWNVDAGGKYKVKCRAVREIYNKNKKLTNTLYSDWSDFSSEVTTIPNAPKGITSLKANSSTEISVTWSAVSNVTSYEVQYTLKKAYFDTNSDQVSSKTIETGCTAIISGLDEGGEYFFRVRAVNDQGKSGWTAVKSCKVGQKPAAPTTWSSTTTAVVGDTVTLYWVHNTQDGSKATKADLELLVDGEDKSPADFEYAYKDDEEEKTYSYVIDTNEYTDGAKIQWRVRTAGVTGVYGDWSVQRTVDVFAPPTLELHLTNSDDEDLDTLSSFPLYVKGIPGPQTQSPIGYHLTVVSTEDYETEDQIGNEKLVSANEEIYSKFFDIKTQLIAELSASNIDLENSKTYKVYCIVTMNSGLTAEAEAEFTVDWIEEEYGPAADVMYNEDTCSCSIRPYCFTTPDEYYADEDTPETTADDTTDDTTDEDEDNEILVENVTLGVYRRDYNGEFIEIASGLDNTSNVYVTDPHPALDYGRYRIVVTSKATGSVSYVDLPGYPISESSVIIQWDETWNNLITSEVNEGEIPDEPVWSGSRVILPYNIDVSDKNDIDVSLVKYVGRKRPVSYYGTQLGETSSWKVEIPKNDDETLYALRRLAIWTGDVYVREPSGTGYWANISVSMSQTHCQLTIPVTLEITRVEGGV